MPLYSVVFTWYSRFTQAFFPLENLSQNPKLLCVSSLGFRKGLCKTLVICSLEIARYVPISTTGQGLADLSPWARSTCHLLSYGLRAQNVFCIFELLYFKWLQTYPYNIFNLSLGIQKPETFTLWPLPEDICCPAQGPRLLGWGTGVTACLDSSRMPVTLRASWANPVTLSGKDLRRSSVCHSLMLVWFFRVWDFSGGIVNDNAQQ